MKDASKAYGDAYEEALNQQLKTVIESTITEDTLNQEMGIEANAHRDSIQRMTAIPRWSWMILGFSYKFDVRQQKRKQKTFSRSFSPL
jgi:hypothetical protein